MKYAKFDPNETNKKIETCGVNPNTERAKRQCEQTFTDFVKSKIGDSHEDIFTDGSLLQNMLIQFFDTYRLNDERLPSKSTLNQVKSFIKGMILRVTKNQFDISNSATFPDFCRLWQAKTLELKRNGRGDVNHVPPVPQSVMEKIFELLIVLTKLMQIDETDPSYQQLLNQLPSSYRENYNKLVLAGAMFVFIYYVSTPLSYFLLFHGSRSFLLHGSQSFLQYHGSRSY